MISSPLLRGLRVGCVQYLNSKPLICGYDGPVVFDHPSGLAADLVEGKLDVALVPIFEALRHPSYGLADGVAIASDGPVFSVFLAHQCPIEEIESIAIDPASLTSVNALQVILAEYYGIRPLLREFADYPQKTSAVLLIGNQAIAFRERDAGATQILDLGAEWKLRTGLPFVYAAWLIRADLPEVQAVAEELRALKDYGIAHLGEVIAGDDHPSDFSRRYLTDHIRFDLGPREKAGLEKFRQLLVLHGLISVDCPPLAFF